MVLFLQLKTPKIIIIVVVVVVVTAYLLFE
jgi:hypothetical protein